MQRFSPVQKAVKTTTVQEMVAPIMYFRFTDAFSGKRRHPQPILDQVLLFDFLKQSVASCILLHIHVYAHIYVAHTSHIREYMPLCTDESR